MQTTFRRLAVASIMILLVTLLFISAGGITGPGHARDLFEPGHLTISGSPPDTVSGSGGPRPENHGDPNDPDKLPPLALFFLTAVLNPGR